MNSIIPSLPSTALPVVIGFELKVVLEKLRFLESTDCQIGAQNDLQAAYHWVNLYDEVPKTYNTYKREVECLLLRCQYERGRSKRELKVEDFEAYFNFLKSPPFTKSKAPCIIWCR